MDKRYSKGTIKIKNISNQMDLFYPLTDISCVIDEKNGLTLEESIDAKLERYTEVRKNGGIEIIYTPNIDSNKYSPNTLFALMDVDDFNITVDVNSSTSNNAAIPFNLSSSSNAFIIVDWGDGTISTLTSADYTESNASKSIHKYSKAGTYTIKVLSADWDEIIYYHLNSSTNSTYYSRTANLSIYNNTLTKVNKKLPKFKCIKTFSSLSTSTTSTNYNCSYMFYCCIKLTDICQFMFSDYSNITDFSYCFYNCTSLASIPEGLFDNCTAVTNFYNCFYQCSSLTSIPTDLFKYNTAVTDFSYCFYNCTSLASIPENLFKYNIDATTFSYCFYGCNLLMSIPQDTFRYNINVTNVSYCFYRSSNNTFTFTLYFGSTKISSVSNFVYSNSTYQSSRKIYALSGSTTYTNFYNSRTSLRITVNTY